MGKNEKNNQKAPKLDFERLIDTPEFKALSKRKSKFLTPYVIFFSLAYAILPFLTAYTNVLEGHAIGYITWTWIYSFGLFAMVWTLSTIYTRKSTGFDKDVKEILEKYITK